MKGWVRRTARLHAELSAVAELRDPAWWVVAGGVALPWRSRAAYVISDAEPVSDTFIGIRRATPTDPLALAHATRDAIRELSGDLVAQPLATTLARGEAGARVIPNELSTAAFATADRVWCVRLDEPDRELALEDASAVPFVCISIGEDPIETARHGHRRAWQGGGGPWIGIGRAAGMLVVSTCHLAIDGYGHARLAERIAARTTSAPMAPAAPPLPLIAGAVPLMVTWRELSSRPRALELGYALGRMLHRLAGDPHARFSPTFQIPLAPGGRDDGERMRRRVVPAIASVRFDAGTPEPFAVFAARTKATLASEANGHGVSAQLMAAARGVPVPLAWKRNAITTSRPRWLDSIASVIGGRGCVSRIEVDVPMPPACAVSSPARLATADDPVGSCVVTVIDDGTHSTLTLCGSGTAADRERLDELLALLPVKAESTQEPKNPRPERF